jgi:creatinine amidohydrolase
VTGLALEGLTTAEVGSGPERPVLLVPLGSTEQHGPHLPLGTDTLIAVALCAAVATRAPGRLVAPALAYGASGEHAGFAGTVSIGSDVLTQVLVEIARSTDSFAGVVLVSAHGGNLEAVRAAEGRVQAEGRRLVAWLPSVAGGDAHAGHTETSLLLHIAPATVRLPLAEPGSVEPLDELWPALRAGGVRAVSPNGVLGDPTGASAEAGREIFDRLADDLEHVVAAASACWTEARA